MEKFNKFIDWFTNIFNAISNVPNKLWDFMKGAFDSIITGIGNFFEFVKTIPSLIVQGFKDLLTFLFVPDEVLDGASGRSGTSTTYISTGKALLMENLNEKFEFIENFKTAFNNFNTAGQPLKFEAKFLGYDIKISLDWYEQHRQKIRSGLSVVFWIACALSCFAMVSNIFGIGVSKGARGIYSEHKGSDD